jgi:DNA-binding NtrC family response regulator
VLLRVEVHLVRARLQQALEEKNRQLEEEIGQRQRLSRRVSQYSQQERERWGLSDFIGQSRSVQAILEEIDLLAEAHAVAVLITGESGTGKELIARAIHYGGPRREGPFVPVNCSAIPRDLADALFFGHIKGSFTGADDNREGYFALAEGGTLFLDEVGDMPPELQPKLLRVLEDDRYRPLGARHRRRPAARNLSPGPLLSAGAIHGGTAALLTYDFPGNVRELKNLVERALIKSRGGEIGPEHLELNRAANNAAREADQVAPALPPDLPLDLEQALEVAEEEVARRALAQSDDNVSAAARLLGTNRPRLYRILERIKSRGSGSRLTGGDGFFLRS